MNKTTPAAMNAPRQQNGSTSSSSTSQIFDIHQITKMYDNGLLCDHTSQVLERSVPRTTFVSAQRNGIEDFLGRPVRLATYVINNATTFIGSLDMSNFTFNPMVADKISNFRYLRGDACYKIVVNANIQSLGRVLVLSSPFETSLPANRQIIGTTTNTQLTTYPHATVDVGTGETLIFRVPYMGLSPVCRLNGLGWSWIRLSMLNAFSGLTGADTCEITVYAWFENFSLSVPVAQGQSEDGWEQLNAGNEKPAHWDDDGAKPAEKTDVESDQKTSRPISSAFSAISAFSAPYHFVPIVGPYIAGIGWLSGLAARAASMFGYSKPLNNSSTQFMSPMPMRGYTHCDGSDDSLSLSLRPSNKVSVDPVNFGVKLDPHCYRSFLSRDHVIAQFTWGVIDGPNTSIQSVTLAPNLIKQSLFNVITDCFEHYAASLIFRVAFVKNVFYSGRLAVQWYPDNVIPGGGWNPAVPSIIIDVKTNDELVFRVPFIDEHRLKQYTTGNGSLVFWVVNPLRVNGDYPQQIDINLHMCVDDSFLVSMPREPALVYAQGLADLECVDERPGNLARKAVDIYPFTPPDANIFTVVDGEFTATISDLLKRFVYSHQWSTTFTSHFTPCYMGASYVDPHPIQRFSNFFRFWRGSFRVKVVMNRPPSTATGQVDNDAIILVKTFYSATLFPPTAGTAITTLSGSLPETQVSGDLNNVVEVSVPYYSISDRSLVGVNSLGTLVPSIQIQIGVSDPIFTDPPVYQVYLACGDDFSFGFACGMPKLT